MKVNNVLWVFALTWLVAAGAAGNNHPLSQKTFSAAFSNGLVSGSKDAFNDAFADDIIIMPEYAKSVLGRADAGTYYDKFLEAFDINQYKRAVIEVIDLGDRRVEIGNFEVVIAPKGESKYSLLIGTYFDVWDTSRRGHERLMTQAWNYDKHVDGIETMFRLGGLNDVNYAFMPAAAVDSPVNYEVAALNALNDKLMLHQRPEALYLIYADDALNAHHNSPPIKGQAAIKRFLADYTKNWPTFDYVSVNAHKIYSHKHLVLEHFSYNLRWLTKDYSGVTLGKGVRILKRNKEGVLQIYRIISMND